MLLAGKILIDDSLQAYARLDFDANEASVEQVCFIFALFALRMISNLSGRLEANQIAHDCKLDNKSLAAIHKRGSIESAVRSKKQRMFGFQCTLNKDTTPRFHLNAPGFGLLAKNVGPAARSAVSELRLKIADSTADKNTIELLDLVANEVGKMGDAGIVSTTNQAKLAALALVLAIQNMDENKDLRSNL